MDYLEKLLKDNENLWQPPMGAAAKEAGAEAVLKKRTALPLTERLIPALAARSAVRDVKAAQAAQLRKDFTQKQTQLARMHPAALHAQIQVRTEQRGTSFGSPDDAALQSVYLSNGPSYEDISRFFERDARRYG